MHFLPDTAAKERQQYNFNTNLFSEINLPICSVAIETNVLVALVEHVSGSVLEINNLRYGLEQVSVFNMCVRVKVMDCTIDMTLL